MTDSVESNSQRISRGFISAAPQPYKNPYLWVATILAILTVVAVGVHAHQQATTTPQPAHHFMQQGPQHMPSGQHAHLTANQTQSTDPQPSNQLSDTGCKIMVAAIVVAALLLTIFMCMRRR